MEKEEHVQEHGMNHYFSVTNWPLYETGDKDTKIVYNY